MAIKATPMDRAIRNVLPGTILKITVDLYEQGVDVEEYTIRRCLERMVKLGIARQEREVWFRSGLQE